MLRDLNITKKQLNDITSSGEVLEFKSNSYYKGSSNIHNIGVFALKDISKNDFDKAGYHYWPTDFLENIKGRDTVVHK